MNFVRRLAVPAVAAAALAVPAVAQAPVGPDAAACKAGEPSILVKITGFRNVKGNIRVQLNDGNPANWLKDNKWIKRVELPVTAATMPVCLKVPGPGKYAIAVRHDEDGDKKMTKADGGGFSRNPKLSITHLKPSHGESVFTVGQGVAEQTVVMNYLQGLSIKPIKR